MHLLAVFAHPRRDSYTGAVLDQLLDGLHASGHTSEIADLHREAFDPRFHVEDYAQFGGGEMPEAIVREQARVDRADALALVFPVWWWSFPAILKGWIDRVFSEGWAYNFTPGLSRGQLEDRPTLVLGVGGSRQSTYRKYGYDEAMRIQIDVGILGYCGLRDVTTRIFHDVEQNADDRLRYLQEAHELGRRFLSEDRQRRIPDLGSDRTA